MTLRVSNGVCKGGLLMPVLISVYMDDLLKQLNGWISGCLVGNSVVSHLVCADDLVILSLYSAG